MSNTEQSSQPTSDPLSKQSEAVCSHWWDEERRHGSIPGTWKILFRCKRCLETKWLETDEIVYD